MLLRRRVKGQQVKGGPRRVSKILASTTSCATLFFCKTFTSVHAVWTQRQTTGKDWLQRNAIDVRSRDGSCCVMQGCFCPLTGIRLDDCAVLAEQLVIVQIPQHLLDMRAWQLWVRRKHDRDQAHPWTFNFGYWRNATNCVSFFFHAAFAGEIIWSVPCAPCMLASPRLDCGPASISLSLKSATALILTVADSSCVLLLCSGGSAGMYYVNVEPG